VGYRASLNGLAHDKISFAHQVASQEYERGVLSALLPRSVTILDPGRSVTPDIKPVAYFLL
jgi:hypothetical protein